MSRKPPHHKEDNWGESETITVGAMTMKQQIQRIEAASMLHQEWKNAHFPGDAEVPDDFIPPGYNPTEMEIRDEQKRILDGKATSPGEARKQVHEKAQADAAAAEAPPEPPPEPPVEPPA